ncbi:MAG: hypothetical protein ACFE75_06135 [Candidatus Hodarchaeota archaeon]
MKKPKFETVVKEFCRESYYKIKEAIKKEPNRSSLPESLISDEILIEILEKIHFDYHNRSKLIARRCLEVIVVSLLNIPLNYKSLLNQLMELTGLGENRIYIYITTYLPILAQVIPELHIKKWLPNKHRTPYTYADIQKIARKVGLEKTGIAGVILTSKEEYNKLIKTQYPAHTHVLVSCAVDGHKPWKITPNNLSRGKWCRKCYRESTKLSYEDIQQLAKRIGMEKIGIPGSFLTSKEEFESINIDRKPSHIKLLFSRNTKGHNAWKTNANRIRQMKWCPECAGGYHEEITRWYFEKIFSVKFPTILVKKILPSYSGVMHFDGYGEVIILGKKFKIAFEYNGRQHYHFPNQFHETYQEFLKRKEYDLDKKKVCKANNITLIIIPFTIKPENIQNHIVKIFESKTNIKLPNLPTFNHKTRFIQSTTLNNFL